MATPAAIGMLVAETGLSLAKRSFIDDFGQMYAHYGLSLSFGRTFALLLINDGPLSLDEIAAHLETSKSAISVATRDLERAGIARRIHRPGSRRVLYEACDDMLPTFEAQFERIRRSLAVLNRDDGLALQGRARHRMREMKALHEFWLAEGEGIVDRWRRRKRE